MEGKQIMYSIHPQDKNLVTAFFAGAIVSIAFGGLMALVIALIRAPAVSMWSTELYYQALSAHAILMFVHWISFIQAALAIGTVTLLLKGNRLYNLLLGWVSFALMAVGWILTMFGVFGLPFGILEGAPVLYTAFPPLAKQYEGATLVYLGYLYLASGVLLLMINISLTILRLVENKLELKSWIKMIDEIHISTFATIMGIIMVIPATIIAFVIYIQAFLWTLDLVEVDAMDWRMTYHMMFHVIHYIPAMVLIGVSYVIVEVSMEAESVYGKRVAKSLFVLYPGTVPPTFLYHLLTDPGISEDVKALGSVLSLLVGLPSVLHMFIIMGMMETKVKSAGYTSHIGWIRRLPWKNPAFSCMIVGMVSMGFGGILGYLLLQGHIAQLLHGTFAVPAYIHPIAAGGASLIYMGASYYMVTGIRKRQLWGLTIARIQPWISMLGLFIFGIAGTMAGYAGVPRRVAEVDLGSNNTTNWETLLNISLLGGGTLMILGGIMFVLVVVMTAFQGNEVDTVRDAISVGLSAPDNLPLKREVKSTPISLIPGLIFIAIILILTLITFWIIEGWTIQFALA